MKPIQTYGVKPMLQKLANHFKIENGSYTTVGMDTGLTKDLKRKGLLI